MVFNLILAGKAAICLLPELDYFLNLSEVAKPIAFGIVFRECFVDFCPVDTEQLVGRDSKIERD